MNSDKDWYDSLTKVERASIERGLEDIESGNTLSCQHVQEEIELRIMALKGSE